MGSKQIDLKEVPGIEVIQARLASIDPGLSVSALITQRMFWN
jgi:hypothetical protein